MRYRVPFLAAEGVRTSDGRIYEALDFRAPPLDLYMQYGSHHSDVNTTELVGHIVDIGRGENGVVWAVLDIDPMAPAPDGERAAAAARHVAAGGQGISSDFVIDRSTLIAEEEDGTIRIAAATIGAATLCSIPAYEQAIVDPTAIEEQALPVSLVASAVAAPVARLVADAGYPLTAAAAVDLASWSLDPAHFAEPDLSVADNSVTVTDDGRVYGWVAYHGSCHASFADACVRADDQSPDLSRFLRNRVQVGDAPMPVGFLTMDTGHAGTSGVGIGEVLAHYDDTRSIAAIVTAGVRDEGIWFSGSVRPTIDAWHRTVLAAGSVSGDWRAEYGETARTLRAALVVPVPGFDRPALAASAGCGCAGASTPPALSAAQVAALDRLVLADLDADLALADLDRTL